VLLGGELLGVLGALIAIPVAGSLQLLVRELTTGRLGEGQGTVPAGTVPESPGPGP
jgi:predicted PurR-regulated permease PerM